MSESKAKRAIPVDAARTELERRLMGADRDGALALLESMSPEQRYSQRASIRRLLNASDSIRFGSERNAIADWPLAGDPATRGALCAALFVVGLPEDAVDIWLDKDEAISLARRFSPRIVDGYADALLAARPIAIATVHAMVVGGVIERPRSDAYAVGLIALGRGSRHTIEAFVDEDPGLLLPDVDGRIPLMRIFDVEGTTEFSLASQDKYSAGSRPWETVLLALAAKGRIPRAMLIERTIDCLESDFAEFRAGWFSRFHDALALTVDESAPYAARYLGMLQSRVPRTRKVALDATTRIFAAGRVDAAEVLEALGPVVTTEAKAHVEAALKLLDAIVERSALHAHEASSLACLALGHASADVQRKALARLRAFGLDDATRERVRDSIPRVAATLRAECEALVGSESTVVAPEPDLGAAPSGPAEPLSPLDLSRRISPIESPIELVECLAHLVQHGDDIEEFERALDALVRLAPFDAETRTRLDRMVRTGRVARSDVASHALELAERIAERIADGAAERPSSESGIGPCRRRISALAEVAILGRGLGPLATPTHRRGFIDAATLLERARRYDAAVVKPSIEEQALAIGRLFPTTDPALRDEARALADTPFARALRHALHDEVAVDRNEPLFLVAARIRHVQSDDPKVAMVFGDDEPGARATRYRWYVKTRPPYAGYVFHDLFLETVSPTGSTKRGRPQRGAAASSSAWSELLYHPGAEWTSDAYLATILPTDLEGYFANGARTLADNLDWSEARWENRAYLTLLLDPTVPMSNLARLVLALGLAAKEPGEATTAVDALIASAREGRLDRREFGGTMRSLFETPIVKVARWHKRLSEAAVVDRHVARVVFDVVAQMLSSPMDPVPKDTSALIELLLELQSAHAFRVDEASLEAIRRMNLPARGKRAAKLLRA